MMARLGIVGGVSLLGGRLDRVVIFETARSGGKNDCRGEKADSSAALRNDNQKNGNDRTTVTALAMAWARLDL